jgi:hypothetical protein
MSLGIGDAETDSSEIVRPTSPATVSPDAFAQPRECLFGAASIYRYDGRTLPADSIPGAWPANVRHHAADLWSARSSMHPKAAPVYSLKTSAVADNAAGTASVTTLVNRPANVAFISRLSQQFTKLFRRKAFLHWYTGESMDEGEFMEAIETARVIVDAYTKHAAVESDGEDSEFELEIDED